MGLDVPGDSAGLPGGEGCRRVKDNSVAFGVRMVGVGGGGGVSCSEVGELTEEPLWGEH